MRCFCYSQPMFTSGFFSHSPNSLDLSGKDELLVFALTFLTSTWYIKNPFLKAKINEVQSSIYSNE